MALKGCNSSKLRMSFFRIDKPGKWSRHCIPLFLEDCSWTLRPAEEWLSSYGLWIGCAGYAFMKFHLEYDNPAPLVSGGQQLPILVELHTGDDVRWKIRILIIKISKIKILIINTDNQGEIVQGLWSRKRRTDDHWIDRSVMCQFMTFKWCWL